MISALKNYGGFIRQTCKGEAAAGCSDVVQPGMQVFSALGAALIVSCPDPITREMMLETKEAMGPQVSILSERHAMVVANIDNGSSGFQITEKSSRSAVLQGSMGGRLSGASRLMPHPEQHFPSASGSESASDRTRYGQKRRLMHRLRDKINSL